MQIAMIIERELCAESQEGVHVLERLLEVVCIVFTIHNAANAHAHAHVHVLEVLEVGILWRVGSEFWSV